MSIYNNNIMYTCRGLNITRPDGYNTLPIPHKEITCVEYLTTIYFGTEIVSETDLDQIYTDENMTQRPMWNATFTRMDSQVMVVLAKYDPDKKVEVSKGIRNDDYIFRFYRLGCEHKIEKTRNVYGFTTITCSLCGYKRIYL